MNALFSLSGARTETAGRIVKERPYSLRVLRNIDDLHALKEAWNRLARRCGAKTFFSGHVFAENSWERHRGDFATRLHVIVVEREGELQLVMPLGRKWDWSGSRILRWLDSKTPLYNDVLVDPAADFEVLTEMVGEHLASLRFIRALKVDFVRQDSDLAQLLQALGADSRFRMTAHEIDLGQYSGWDAFFASRSKTSRQDYRRLFRRLGDHGGVKVEVIDDPKRLEEEISWIFALKRAWVLQRMGKPNWLSPPETEAWFRSTAVELSGDGQAFVLRMSCGDARVAAILVFRWRDTLFASKMAYDPAWAKYSPGWLLNWELIKLSFGEGIDHIDLMLGDEEWKERLTGEVCDTLKYRLSLRSGLVPATRGDRR